MAKPASFEYSDDVGVLYVVGEENCGTPVKIGLAQTAAHARRRMLSMSTGNPRRLVIEHLRTDVPHGRWMEHVIHTVLRPWLVVLPNSREWFDVREVAADNWALFLDAAIGGSLPGGDPRPDAGLPASAEHRLLHVEGIPRHLRSVCSCGWASTIGSVFKALAAAETHLRSVIR